MFSNKKARKMTLNTRKASSYLSYRESKRMAKRIVTQRTPITQPPLPKRKTRVAVCSILTCLGLGLRTHLIHKPIQRIIINIMKIQTILKLKNSMIIKVLRTV